jgi:2,2-dialkylglycine decarboxylase (pyruvate)
MGGTFRIASPLTTTEPEVDKGLTILDKALSNVTGGGSVGR